ncbi:MAG TPA: 2-phospho-L-lactate guanylyltransferase [Solirubrobacteraceae bacterium]|jgi:2-phospho-L-lactate guanylyltransferase|nr:2-phospho-L-lactate guanylyltransferase [Solirubrobacteraceae bacterium]
MRTAAILPVKRFPLAKQRLGESVAESLRANLARAMVGDVLSSLRECPAIDTTIVVTCEPSVAAAALYIDAVVVEDTAEQGQSAAASLGLAHALRASFERALCVPGDCPTLDPDELVELLVADTPRESVDPEVVIVPDRHGKGTNGLLLSPPDALSPSFGPDSRTRHERLATKSGVKWRIAQPASLLLDIDTGEDLAALQERLAGEHVRAPRTRAVLARAETKDRTSKATPTDPSTTTRAA